MAVYTVSISEFVFRRTQNNNSVRAPAKLMLLPSAPPGFLTFTVSVPRFLFPSSLSLSISLPLLLALYLLSENRLNHARSLPIVEGRGDDWIYSSHGSHRDGPEIAHDVNNFGCTCFYVRARGERIFLRGYTRFLSRSTRTA